MTASAIIPPSSAGAAKSSPMSARHPQRMSRRFVRDTRIRRRNDGECNGGGLGLNATAATTATTTTIVITALMTPTTSSRPGCRGPRCGLTSVRPPWLQLRIHADMLCRTQTAPGAGRHATPAPAASTPRRDLTASRPDTASRCSPGHPRLFYPHAHLLLLLCLASQPTSNGPRLISGAILDVSYLRRPGPLCRRRTCCRAAAAG